jgi:hypothetical protein
LPKGRKYQFPRGNFPGITKPLSEDKKRPIIKKLEPESKKLELNCTNSELNCKKTCLGHAKMPDPCISYGLKVKNKTIRVLLDSGSSGDLLFMKKGSSKRIAIAKRVFPQKAQSTSNGIFITNKVGDIEISFVEYSARKKVRLQPDIVEYSPGDQAAAKHQCMASKPCMTRGSIGHQRKDNTNGLDPLTYEEHHQSVHYPCWRMRGNCLLRR